MSILFKEESKNVIDGDMIKQFDDLFVQMSDGDICFLFDNYFEKYSEKLINSGLSQALNEKIITSDQKENLSKLYRAILDNDCIDELE